MKAEQAKRLGERIELALEVDPEAVRNVLSCIEDSARDAMRTSDSVRWIAGMLVTSDAINEAVQ